MTQEQKAKTYDEAIERAKKWYDANTNEGYRGIFDDIFPELKESEDERIRKALIEMVHDTTGDSLWVDYNVHKEDVLAWLEKQGKQNVDKVEPKFKVGDWVIDVQGVSSNQIIGYEDDSYYIETSCSKFYLPMKLAEKNYRLWIIQDAKDGDVLYLQKDGKEHIIIYKGVIKERFRTFVSAYCAYNGIVDAFCFADVSRYVDIAYRGIMPATKEQRDILFKKMKEAGYEWDAGKKELKKIEQKPAWSEEDKEILYGIIKDIEVLKEEGRNKDVKAAYQREIDWLKSLRPQNRWKPSDEQMERLKGTINSLPHQEVLYSLYQDLKKLREDKL